MDDLKGVASVAIFATFWFLDVPMIEMHMSRRIGHDFNHLLAGAPTDNQFGRAANYGEEVHMEISLRQRKNRK